jgi:hypothetical protein
MSQLSAALDYMREGDTLSPRRIRHSTLPPAFTTSRGSRRSR